MLQNSKVWCVIGAGLMGLVNGAVADDAPGIKLTESSSISPFGEVSITYDDNVPLNPDGFEIDDM